MQSNRNKTEKGPGGWMCTSLNASCAYNLNRLAKIKPGDVVLDPMGGLGTIPIGRLFLTLAYDQRRINSVSVCLLSFW